MSNFPDDTAAVDAVTAANDPVTEEVVMDGTMPDDVARRAGALERWSALSGKARGALALGAVLVVYFAALVATGPHGAVHRHAPIGFVLVGVVYGSVNALGAMGLILVYRANRFINFAHGALGSLVGVLAIGMVKIHGVDYWVALPGAVLVGALVGSLIEVTTIRRFRNSPRLLLLVASVGLAQVLGGLEFLGSKHEGFTGLTGAFAPPFNVSIRIDVYKFHSAEILAVAVVPVVISALAWFLLKTNAGIAVRASAENSDRAMLLGIPVRRLSTIVWTIAGALAVLTYMLSAPFEGVKPGIASNGPITLLPMLAIAVVARMESLPVAFGAGIGLGIMEAIVRWNTTGNPAIIWAIYLAVIVVALLAQSNKLSRAEESGSSSWSAVGMLKPIPGELRRLPEVRWARRGLLVALAAAFIWVPHMWGSSNQLLAGFAMVWAMIGVSLVVLTGWGGQISLGQFGIAGVAGLVAGNMLARWNVDFFVVIAVSAAVGAAVALLVGLPALRIKGLFLAVTTLALAIALDQYFLNQATFPQFIPAYGVQRPMLLQRFDLNSEYAIYLVCLAFLGLSILATMGLRKARAGRVLIGTKDNERAAASAAVPTTRIKLAGFAVAGVIAGVAGALDVLLLQALNPGSFPPIDSITVFGYSVIGGLGSVTGVLIGILSFKYVESITALGQVHLLISGAALLWVTSVLPGGLGQLVYNVRDRLLRIVADRRGILVPSLVADRRVDERRGHAPREETLLSGALTDADNGAEAAPSDERGDWVPGESVVAEASEVIAAASGPTETRAEPLLQCRQLDLAYGPVQILFGVDFEVHEGELVALLGTNGAGKSTLLKGVCGLVRPKRGSVVFSGEDITKAHADATARRGISMMPGGKGVFPTLTVAENLRMAAWLNRHRSRQVEKSRDEVLSLFPILSQRYDQMAGNLSGGEQQMLALGMALMTRPQLLMIDELALGLAPTIVGQLLDVVEEVHRRGTTVVIVEQSVNVALNLAKRAAFMEKGEVRFEGPTSELLERPDILRSVFIAGAGAATKPAVNGGDVPVDVFPAHAPEPQEALHENGGAKPVLECREVVKTFGGITAVDHVDLTVRRGEIVGLIGHNGAGKTTLMDCISGFLKVDQGRVVLRGVDVTDWLPDLRARGALGRSFQDALLFPTLTVAETIALARERHLQSRDMFAAALQLPASFESELAAMATVDELVELMGLGAYREKLTGELSTGTRRIVDLACIMAQDPKVLMLDEPSAGIAQRETEALGPLLRRVREQTGCSMLVVEHDMPMLSGLCDRLVALELGGVITEGTPEEVLAHPAVIASYLGTDDTAIARSGTTV